MSIGAGAFMENFAGGAQFGMNLKDRKDQRDLTESQMEANRELAKQNQSLIAALGMGGSGGTAGAGGGYASSSQAKGGGGSSGGLAAATDPANTSMPGYQRAFLNAIAGPESGGRYNVRYTPNGGATFDVSTGEHPRIYETRPDDGRKSSAAGRYQFTATTWDRLGGGAFTPERQDEMAWKLAVDDYGRRTGRDLTADLTKNGMTREILSALQPTWEGLGAGHSGIIDAYNNSLTRYRDTARATNTAPVRQQTAQTSTMPSLAETVLSDEERGARLGKSLLGAFKKQGAA